MSTVQQAAIGDSLSFDPFSFDQNGLAPPEVDVAVELAPDGLRRSMDVPGRSAPNLENCWYICWYKYFFCNNFFCNIFCNTRDLVYKLIDQVSASPHYAAL